MNVSENRPRCVRILVNRKSGFMWSFKKVQRAFDEYWDIPENDLSYQFCKSAEDGRIKAKRAVEQGVDVLLVIGGDGTINTVGAELIGTNTALGAIPMGSGNGFARHFGISLDPEIAAFHLATGMVKSIDVGLMNNRPFLITCSMAWDAAIVRSFQKSPVRGILPYVFAGAYEFFGYEPQPIDVVLETGERLSFPEPLVFTIANLTQYGANLHITDNAEPDDGMMELVVAGKQDIPALLNHLMSLKNRSIAELPSVTCRSFQKLTVIRDHQGVIQLDGELVEAPKVVEVKVLPSALKVLVPMQIEA